ncbi:MAG: peptidoglycan-binding protein [Nitrosomonas sp.]|nr:peptidoglycan-binding protein [Nitrosomonas sp.]
MKSSKIRILSTSVALLFSAGLLSGCGDEPDEAVTQSNEIIMEEPIQSIETIIEPEPITSFEDDDFESYGNIDLEEEGGSNSVEGILGELSDAASETIDAAEETTTEAADTLVNIIDENITDAGDAIAGLQEGVSSEIDTAIAEPVADIFDDGEEVVAATPDLIRRVQQALVKAGYNPGPVDGISGPRTLTAIKDFQQGNNLAAGALTKETLRTLGVDF